MSGYTAHRALSPNPNDWQWQEDATRQDIAFLIYQENSAVQHWRWAAKAANNERIAHGGEGYVNRADCVTSARRMGFRGV